jgi:sec-independent protein translocase protein TatA
MGEFSIMHILVVAVLLLIFFGPSRLPGLGQSIGKAIRGFKDGLSETTNDLHQPSQSSNQNPNQQIPPVDDRGVDTHGQAQQTAQKAEKPRSDS